MGQTNQGPKHEPPYLWMGPKFGVWLELSTDDSQAELEAFGNRLCEQFSAKVIEKYPEGRHCGDEDYWTLLIGDQEFLLMRQRYAGLALGTRNATSALVQIAKQLGVTKRVGWRWWPWDLVNAFRSLLPKQKWGTRR
jgi:hypothetical protein